jgi:hypothetical protein
MPTDILALSWKVQVAIASGYAAYIVSYRGIRSHHSAQDTLFLSLVFSLVATGTLWLCRDLPPPLAGTWALITSLAAGLFWRRHGMQLLTETLRGPNTTWADDTPSAWVRLQENREFPVSQISVLLKDGTWLNCDETSKFNDAPYGPCVLGTNGDILIYLTSTTPKVVGTEAVKDKVLKTVLHEQYGARLTYVPSGEIARVNIRLMPSLNRRARVEALPLELSAAEPSVGYWLRLRRGLAAVLQKVAAAIS